VKASEAEPENNPSPSLSGPRTSSNPRGPHFFRFWYNGPDMRPAAFLLAFALGAGAQGVTTRIVKDAAGRIEIAVPDSWQDAALAEGELIHVNAPHAGGHMLIAVREAGQTDVDKQRDRYMAHDAGRYPGAEFQKIADPFFGYRMNDPAKNRVLLRGFVRDGADGVVVTVSSRFQAYDAYAKQTMAVLGSLRAAGAPGAPGAPADASAGPGRRIFDKGGRFSFVAPVAWKTITAEEGEMLALGLKGLNTQASVRVVEEGDQDNPNLILITIQGRWKRDYAGSSAERVGTAPPALLVKNRKEGWVDYVIAFAAGGRGFTLRLASREGAFETTQKDADAMARSLVFLADPYKVPDQMPGAFTREIKKSYVVHAAAGEGAAADATVDAVTVFDRDWSRIAPAPARKGVQIHVVLAAANAFAEASNGFGDVPAAYDRSRCTVVAVAPPADKEEALRWRGRLCAVLAEAALHRDLAVAAPPWLLGGLAACMEAAGRTGEGPQATHFALRPKLEVESRAKFPDVLAYSYADVLQGETLEPLALSWGYTHLMLFGKGTLKTIYVKWARDLAKATKKTPAFELGKYAEAEADLKKHVDRELKQ